MKKNLFAILVLVLAMLLSTAVAENMEAEIKTVSEKITLWTHDVVIMDQADEMTTYPLNVTFEPKAPVELTVLPVAEQLKDQIYIASVTREGVGNVMIAISPADRGLHFNLNDYTDEMLADYIKSVAEANFPDGDYTSEVRKSEGGNTYVSVGTEYQETLSTIYDDLTMEFFLMRDPENGELIPLTDADRAFAVEMFQSVWTEDAKAPTMDTAVTMSVNEKFLSDFGIANAKDIAAMLNNLSLVVHGQDNFIHMALKSGDEEVLYFDITSKDNAAVLMSNAFGDKGIIVDVDPEQVKELESAKTDEIMKQIELEKIVGNIDFTNTMNAAMSAMDLGLTEDGALTFAISAENAKKILSAMKEDLKASGAIGKIFSVFSNASISDNDVNAMIDEVIDSMGNAFQEKDFFEGSMRTNADGDQVISGTVKYNGTDYEIDENTYDIKTIEVPTIASFAIILHVDDKGMFLDMAEYSGPENAETRNTVLMKVNLPNTGDFDAEFTYGSSTNGTLKKDFTITLNNTKATEELGDMNTTKLAFNMADEKGNLNEVFNVVNLFSGRGADNIQAFMLNMNGYEEPVLAVRTAQVFSSDVTIPEPAELVNFKDLTPEMSSQITQTVIEKLNSIAAPSAQ